MGMFFILCILLCSLLIGVCVCSRFCVVMWFSMMMMCGLISVIWCLRYGLYIVVLFGFGFWLLGGWYLSMLVMNMFFLCDRLIDCSMLLSSLLVWLMNGLFCLFFCLFGVLLISIYLVWWLLMLNMVFVWCLYSLYDV